MKMKSAFSVKSPAPRDVWQTLAAHDSDTLITQTPAWIDCICEQGNYVDASRLYEFRNGKQIILPLVQRRWLPRAVNMAASMPHAWGIGGLLSSAPLVPEDIEAIFADLRQVKYLDVHLRPNPLHGDVWAAAQVGRTVTVPRLAHVLDLEGGFDEVWRHRFRQGTRANVRRAERAGVEIECDTTGKLMPVFYELFEKSVARWADQQNEPHWLAQWRAQQRDPLQKFLTIAHTLGEACRVWVARHNGTPVASIIVLQGANAHYTRGAMNQELAGPLHANYLLQKMSIEDACNHGCRYYHMGESGASESLAHYKTRFGAVAYPYAEYNLERVPLTQIDGIVRRSVKRVIGFKDISEHGQDGPVRSPSPL